MQCHSFYKLAFLIQRCGCMLRPSVNKSLLKYQLFFFISLIKETSKAEVDYFPTHCQTARGRGRDFILSKSGSKLLIMKILVSLNFTQG